MDNPYKAPDAEIENYSGAASPIKRPATILVAVGYLALTCMYGVWKLPYVLRAEFAVLSHVIALVLTASALLTLNFKPSVGRWVTVAVLALGILSNGLTFLLLVLKGQQAWLLLAFIIFLSVLGYLLAFGRSTQAYLAAVANSGIMRGRK